MISNRNVFLNSSSLKECFHPVPLKAIKKCLNIKESHAPVYTNHVFRVTDTEIQQLYGDKTKRLER